MARYNAKLLKLLVRVRKRTEDVRATALADTHRSIAQGTAYRDQLLSQRRAQLEAADARTRGDFDASDVRRFYQHERHLAQLTDVKDAELQALSDKAGEQRGELEEALKARKVVEKLHDRKRDQYVAEIEKREQQDMDEVALMHQTSKKEGTGVVGPNVQNGTEQ